MAIFTEGALTKKGQALISKCETRGVGIYLTCVKTGAGVHTDTSVSALEQVTDLLMPMQEFGISDLETIEGNAGVAVITTVLNNRGLQELYYLNELGVFADDPDEGEILYCILVSENNMIYMPPENGMGGVSCITERIYLEVTNAERTTINADGAVVSATDFLALKKIVKAVDENIQSGTEGQILTKNSSDPYDYSWKDINTVTRPFADFPRIGRKDAIYVDSDSSEIYLWKTLADGTENYFKLPLGAEASQTLQKQITDNANNITALQKRTSALELRFDEVIIMVPSANWVSTVQDGVTVYTQSIDVTNMSVDTKANVWAYIQSTTADAIDAEQKALGIFFAHGTVDGMDEKVDLKCYRKKPNADFGLLIQGCK